MRAMAKLFGSVAVLTALVASAPAYAGRMTDYDLNKLDNWSDAIAVCDVTRFLLTEPDISADVILVAGRDNTRVVLYRPLYAPPTNFFSDVMRETFERVSKAGLTTLDAYAHARLRFAREMIASYGSVTMAEKRYMADQMELCYHLANRAGVKLTPARRQTP